MELQRHVDDALRVFRGRHFCHGGGDCPLAPACGADTFAFAVANAQAIVAKPCRTIGQQRSCINQRGHLAKLRLGHLKIRQRLPKHLPLL